MDFLDHFGLKEDPFKLTPDPAYFYPSASHNEGLLLMDYSVDQREGFILVIGDPGTGKTTLLRVFLERWKDRAETAIVLTPRLSPEEFLISVADDLNINLRDKNKNEIIRALRDLMMQRSSEGKRVIIIVDEAQNLPDETLEELRLLSNLETDKDKLLQIVMLGQPELESKLTGDNLRQLNQRITTRVHLRHFNAEETLDYINYRLIKAGKQNLQVARKAGALAYRHSRGVPRLINMLMSRALMAAYLEDSSVILPQHISHAVKSLNHNELRSQNMFGIIALSAGAAVIVLIIIAGLYMRLGQHNEEPPAGHTRSSQEQAEASPSTLASDKSETDKSTPEPQTVTIKDQPSPQLRTRGGTSPESMDRTVGAIPEGVPDGQVPPEAIQIPAHKIVSVKVDVANVRDRPDIEAPRVGWSPKGIQMIVLQEFIDGNNMKWYLVPFEGEKRWISEEVVDVTEINPRSE